MTPCAKPFPISGKSLACETGLFMLTDQIDFEILWDAIHSDLPDLKIRLENYLAEGESV